MTAPATPHQASCVMIGGRAVLIEGAPGTGKSSLALALIDRGAAFVGDDGVLLSAVKGRLLAGPHPRIAGKLEVRNLGIVDMPFVDQAPVALVLTLDRIAPRHVTSADVVLRAGLALPLIRLWPETPVLALRAEMALRLYGLVFD
jgi:serine kinase of HPr protein (carbohydrate metabolism regulator)